MTFSIKVVNSEENKPASLLVVPLGKALRGISLLGVVDRWSATAKVISL